MITLMVCGGLVFSGGMFFEGGSFHLMVKDSHGTVLAAEKVQKGKFDEKAYSLKSETIKLDVDLNMMKADLHFKSLGNNVDVKDLQCAWAPHD